MAHAALFLSLIAATLATPLTAHAQSGTIPQAVARTSAYTCEINGAISLAGDPKKVDGQTLVGRGMASCKNDQGFSTDYPIVMKLKADASLQSTLTNAGVKVVAQPFAVTHDPNEMFDSYKNYEMVRPRVAAQVVRTLQSSDAHLSSRSVVVHGDRNKLFINIMLLGDTNALASLKIYDFALEYDDNAPTLD